MFSGILFKQKAAIRNIAITGMVLLLAVNVMEMCGIVFFNVNTHGMIVFDRFALLFTTIAGSPIPSLIISIIQNEWMKTIGLLYMANITR